MKKIKDLFKRVYLVGIGGVSMSALAKYLLFCGVTVFGYDRVASEQTEELLSRGVKISFSSEVEQEFFSCDALVYSDALQENDVRLIEGKRAGIKLFRRAQFLSLIGKDFLHTLAVAGSHGKTTCTAMCAHVLEATGVAFGAHIGGVDARFGNFYCSGQDYFVTEVCEYKKNMLFSRTELAILLNIDPDHMECYDGEEDLILSFERYAKNAGTAFVCADDARSLSFCREYTTFAVKTQHADYRAEKIKTTKVGVNFTVVEYGKPLCRIKLKVSGRHNVYNALASFAAMRAFGFNEKEIKAGLENFAGVKRRYEKIGRIFQAQAICDYAHHPREITSVIKTAKSCCKGRLFIVFQPHTYSRTRLLMRDFVTALSKEENLLVYKTFAAREFFDESGSAKTLAQNVGCLYAETPKQIKAWLKSSLKAGDTVLFLGAGDIYHVAKRMVGEVSL